MIVVPRDELMLAAANREARSPSTQPLRLSEAADVFLISTHSQASSSPDGLNMISVTMACAWAAIATDSKATTEVSLQSSRRACANGLPGIENFTAASG